MTILGTRQFSWLQPGQLQGRGSVSLRPSQSRVTVSTSGHSQGWEDLISLAPSPPCFQAWALRIRRGRWAPQPGGGTCSGWPTARCHRRSAAGQSRTRALGPRPTHIWPPGTGQWLEVLTSCPKKMRPLEATFLPSKSSCSSSGREAWVRKRRERATNSRAPGPPPTLGKGTASKSGFGGPVAGVLPTPHVWAPGPASQLEAGAAHGPLVASVCSRAQRGQGHAGACCPGVLGGPRAGNPCPSCGSGAGWLGGGG